MFVGSVGATNMNEHSSRSHAIFTITIERSEKGIDGQQHVRMGKLHMVDLAVSLTLLLSLSVIMLNLTTSTLRSQLFRPEADEGVVLYSSLTVCNWRF